MDWMKPWPMDWRALGVVAPNESVEVTDEAELKKVRSMARAGACVADF